MNKRNSNKRTTSLKRLTKNSIKAIWRTSTWYGTVLIITSCRSIALPWTTGKPSRHSQKKAFNNFRISRLRDYSFNKVRKLFFPPSIASCNTQRQLMSTRASRGEMMLTFRKLIISISTISQAWMTKPSVMEFFTWSQRMESPGFP